MTARRPILTGLVAVAATVTGLAFYAWLYRGAREEQRDADDMEVLRAIADRRWPDLSPLALTEAWARLQARGELTVIEGQLYLTRAGWARVGSPLSEAQVAALRVYVDSDISGFVDRQDAFKSRYGHTLWDTTTWLIKAGFVDNNNGLTLAGRAVLGPEVDA